MARGVIPRQPSKSGRHEGRRAPVRGTSPPQKQPPSRVKPAVKREGKAKRPSAAVGGKRGYDPRTPERVQEILQRLDATYPGATCALHHNNAWELLVATILSAQCTDERVNKTTPELFRKYPTVQAFAALQPEQLEPDIRSTGFFRNKSKSVVGAAKMIVSDFGGQVPSQMEQLLSLPGVARKTANVLLGTWFHKNEGVVVDTHVYRISRRLELTTNTDPNKVEQDLVRIIPRERWTSFSHQVIWHGRKLCMARSPKCVDCPLETICHAADKTWSTVDIHQNAKP
ncbi:MAG: endonuclease III [Acidobacteriia bacterium]|nr:endonuclease III [Terriglobia bacterium]